MRKDVFWRSGFNYDVDEVSQETGLDCSGDPGVTQQSFRDECDINTIVERFGLTGELPNGIAMPLSGDFVNAVDFQTAMNLVRQGEEAFMDLPGHVRARFANDPQRVLEFLENAENREEAIKLGMVSKPPEVTRDAVKAIDELAAKLVVPKAAA